MDPRVIVMEGFSVIGVSGSVPANEAEKLQRWHTFKQRKRTLRDIRKTPITIGMTDCGSNGEGSYIAGMPVIQSDIPKGMIQKEVPGGLYVMATHRGESRRMLETFDYLYFEWMAESGYRPLAQASFEMYDERFLGPDNPDSKIDLYIPVSIETSRTRNRSLVSQ
ncbi:GyrI-like domain-containing protein [Thalassobacillus hwangdonensis]|uniref:GyrI-like domain-containing protein n=1 Tax=Thalassobacillus hwangdonensis TaxID=546108 RepID=A0ABW3L052_9BACI